MTHQQCLREASIAELIAAQVSLDTDRARMLRIAEDWRSRAQRLLPINPRPQSRN
jgi:phage shock protein A